MNTNSDITQKITAGYRVTSEFKKTLMTAKGTDFDCQYVNKKYLLFLCTFLFLSTVYIHFPDLQRNHSC